MTLVLKLFKRDFKSEEKELKLSIALFNGNISVAFENENDYQTVKEILNKSTGY